MTRKSQAVEENQIMAIPYDLKKNKLFTYERAEEYINRNDFFAGSIFLVRN